MKKLKLFSSAIAMLFCIASFGQDKVAKGTVSNKTERLPGANISVKGTNRGTQTDIEGKFSIKAKIGEILEISFTGMKTQQVYIGANSNEINVKLIDDFIIEETYGDPSPRIRKKEEFSVIKVSKKDLKKSMKEKNSLNKKLEGKTQGINLYEEKEKTTIINRCNNQTINSEEEPLYVIDGIITTKDIISKVNPSNIETATVLKGNSATAIYGKNGRNGVIIFTTKNLTKRDLKKLKKQSEEEINNKKTDTIIIRQ